MVVATDEPTPEDTKGLVRDDIMEGACRECGQIGTLLKSSKSCLRFGKLGLPYRPKRCIKSEEKRKKWQTSDS